MRTFVVLIGGLVLQAAKSAACPPAGVSRAKLVKLHASEGAVADDAKRQALAIGNWHGGLPRRPGPFLRDDIGFGLLESWLRAQRLDAAWRIASACCHLSGERSVSNKAAAQLLAMRACKIGAGRRYDIDNLVTVVRFAPGH